MFGRVRCLAIVVLSFSVSSCAELVQYTDELSDGGTGRTLVVTSPAALGGVVGFLVGIPADIALLPVTYAVYQMQSSGPEAADALSTLAFPSVVLWRAGKLIAMPLDLMEFLVYRAWRSPETLTRQEREAIEDYHDRRTLPCNRVLPIYPTDGLPVWDENSPASLPFRIPTASDPAQR